MHEPLKNNGTRVAAAVILSLAPLPIRPERQRRTSRRAPPALARPPLLGIRRPQRALQLSSRQRRGTPELYVVPDQAGGRQRRVAPVRSLGDPPVAVQRLKRPQAGAVRRPRVARFFRLFRQQPVRGGAVGVSVGGRERRSRDFGGSGLLRREETAEGGRRERLSGREGKAMSTAACFLAKSRCWIV